MSVSLLYFNVESYDDVIKILNFNSKTAGGRGSVWLPPPCAFFKNVSSREGETLIFVTFNIIISHIFPENFIKFLKPFRRYEEFLCQH